MPLLLASSSQDYISILVNWKHNKRQTIGNIWRVASGRISMSNR